VDWVASSAGMTTQACASYAGHGFLGEIISYAVWLNLGLASF